MENTKIEWADHTANFWSGCSKVSPGCANCYSETLAARFPTFGKWGKGAPRMRHMSADKLVRKLNRAAGVDELSAKHILRDDKAGERNIAWAKAYRRPRVFVNSLSDWLDPEVPVEWLADLLLAIRTAPHLDFLLLTKRPQLWRERIQAVATYLSATRPDDAGGSAHDCTEGMANAWLGGTPPHNVWIGTSVEDQTRADERIPHLLEIPARVRFLSCEPLLGPVRLLQPLYAYPGDSEIVAYRFPRGIHWVIVGGESGPGARPMHPDWARSLRDQCQAADVAFFFKQWGEWCPGTAILKRYDPAKPEEYVNEVRWCSTGTQVGITEHAQQRNLTTPEREPHRFEDGEILTYRIGKKAAGRLLDGREWNEFPTP